MVTRLSLDSPSDLWKELLQREEDTGEIPLPAVESIVLEEGYPPSISVIAPAVLPSTPIIFVDLNNMPPADRLRVDVLLRMLTEAVAHAAGRKARVKAVWHRGGLDYDFAFAGPGAAELADIESRARPLVWVLLQELATIGAQYPDMQASIPKSI